MLIWTVESLFVAGEVAITKKWGGGLQYNPMLMSKKVMVFQIIFFTFQQDFFLIRQNAVF
jgi:hypothetical protein